MNMKNIKKSTDSSVRKKINERIRMHKKNEKSFNWIQLSLTLCLIFCFLMVFLFWFRFFEPGSFLRESFGVEEELEQTVELYDPAWWRNEKYDLFDESFMTVSVKNFNSLADDVMKSRGINVLEFFECENSEGEWKKCVNEKYGFSFEYPSDWNILEVDERVALVGPSENLRDEYVFEVGRYELGDSGDAHFMVSDEGEDVEIAGFQLASRKKYIHNDYVQLLFAAQDENIVYLINDNLESLLFAEKIGLSAGKLDEIFERMIESFRKQED